MAAVHGTSNPFLNMSHNIALVDDHHMMRAGLVTTINGMGDYHVTLEAGNGKELVDALAAIDLSGPDAPAIAIVDLNMPVMDGYATIAWLHEHAPKVLPLVLTFDATADALVQAVRAGARGFILKTARPSVLRMALDSLVLTGFYYNDETQDAQERDQQWKTREENERERVLEQITPREMEFLLHVCDPEEATYEEIAEQMGVHRRTVDNFRIALFEKFNIKSKTGLVLFAMRWKLI